MSWRNAMYLKFCVTSLINTNKVENYLPNWHPFFTEYTVFRSNNMAPKEVSAEDILIAEGTATLELADKQVCRIPSKLLLCIWCFHYDVNLLQLCSCCIASIRSWLMSLISIFFWFFQFSRRRVCIKLLHATTTQPQSISVSSRVWFLVWPQGCMLVLTMQPAGLSRAPIFLKISCMSTLRASGAIFLHHPLPPIPTPIAYEELCTMCWCQNYIHVHW